MSNDLYNKKAIETKKVSDILKEVDTLQTSLEGAQTQPMRPGTQVSTTELARRLGTGNNVIIDCAKRCGIKKNITNGIATYWNEKEVSMIIAEFKEGNKSNNRSFQLTERLSRTQTSISIKENFLKATQDYIALIEEEKKQLQETNEILLKQKSARDNIVADRCDNQKLFADLNKAIRKYAILNNIANPVAYRYFYDKLCDIHCFTDKLTMEKLKKYPKYAKELLDIVLLELKI